MKKYFIHIAVCVTLLILAMSLDACSGCVHRQRKMRSCYRTHSEMRGNHNRTNNSYSEESEEEFPHSSSDSKITDRIGSIAQSEDYDAMLDCMFEQLGEMRKLEKVYLRGNMSDKEVEEKIREINETYRPVSEALEMASGEGNLNYRQHKRQMKLAGEYLKLIRSIEGSISSDFYRNLK